MMPLYESSVRDQALTETLPRAGALSAAGVFAGGIKTMGLEERQMRYFLENEMLRVEIDSRGAEVKSVKRKSDGLEYMWQGDPRYWERTSPVLFPFVGMPKNKEYFYEGKRYAMGQHGFARDMEFSCEYVDGREAEACDTRAGNSIWFALVSDEQTYRNYPFSFCLHIGYELLENEVKVSWCVENTDEKIMYFSIGAHPGFLCPIHGEKDKLGYGLRFGGLTDELHHHGNSKEGLAVLEDHVLKLSDGVVLFTPGFFDNCTYMADHKQTGEVALLDREGNAYVTVCFDAPMFALWSPEGKDAPFVCIEPWYGRCDAEDFEGSIAERTYENALAPGGSFEAFYRMVFAV